MIALLNNYLQNDSSLNIIKNKIIQSKLKLKKRTKLKDYKQSHIASAEMIYAEKKTKKELNQKSTKSKTMKKFLFITAVAAVAMCSLWVNGTSKGMQLSALEKANIEALSGTNDTDKIPPCTGPKINGDCQCTNDHPCKDLTGCQ